MTVSYQFRKINDLITWHEMALRPEPLADGEFRRHVEESLKRDFGLEGCVENVEGILYELPASICETPYGKLPFNLMMAIFRSHVFWQDAKNQAEAGRIPPKSAGLFKLRTAAQVLRRQFKDVPHVHRELLEERMHNAAMKRNYGLTALAMDRGYLVLDELFEVLEEGLTSLCGEPEPISKKQVEILSRQYAVLSICKAFEKSGRGKLNKNQLTTVAKAFAPHFPSEAGLADIKPSTVRDILRTKKFA